MIKISSGRAGPMRAGLALLSWMLAAEPASAVRVDDLYAASVPVADASPEATRAAFAEALRRVLVKATGRGSAAQDAAVMSQFGNPEAMVQQFRRDGGGLWAQFDAAAVRRGLKAAGLPVWGENRPATVVWLAYDTGSGERDVLAGGGSADGPGAAALRRDLLDAAAARAVPVVLPLRDSQDLAAVTYADLWGDFTAPVIKASARYQADAVLIGRARLFPAGMPDVRWTLLLGDERLDWRGGVADGPAGLADHLAERLASSGSTGGQALRLGVSGVRTLDDYGLLLGYLQGLDVVESLNLVAISADAMTFDLSLRGDHELLARVLAVGRVVEPVADAPPGAAVMLPAGGPPDLSYRLNSVP